MDSTFSKSAVYLPAIVAIGVFATILTGDFVYDDIVLIRDNPFMQSWGNIIDAFSLPYWQISGDERVSTGYYRPLASSSLVLIYQLGNGHPFLFHLVSLLLHGSCAALVAALALQLSWPTTIAWSAGLIFAVHGAHVEAVAWISAMPDLLATLFGIIAIKKWLQNKFWAAAIYLGLGLLSKESVIGIGIFFALDAIRQRSWKLAYPPITITIVAVWLMRATAFQSLWAGLDIKSTDFMLGHLHTSLISLGLFAKYLLFLLWPWPHSPFPSLNVANTAADLSVWMPAWTGGAMLVGLSYLWWKKNTTHSWVRIGIGLCLACLLPILNTQMLGAFPFQERYAYLASAGFSLAFPWLIFNKKFKQNITICIMGIITLGHASSTLNTTPKWNNEEALFTWARQQSPESMSSWMGSGRLALEKSQNSYEGTPKRIEYAMEALKFYKQALAINASEWMVSRINREYANTGQGDALFLAGDYSQAELVYKKTLEGYPESAAARIGLANCKTRKGEQKGIEGDMQTAHRLWKEALNLYKEASDLFTSLVVPIHGQGACLAFLGDFKSALPFLEKAFDLDPKKFEYGRSLAEVQVNLGNTYFARKTLETLISNNPTAPWVQEVQATIKQLQTRNP